MVDASSFLAIAGAITSQTVLITGFLYYSGWARAQATLAYFGLDTSLAGYSTSDYLLRSVNVTFSPLIRLGLITLILLALHWLVVQRSLKVPAGSRARRLGRLIVSLTQIAAVALTAAVVTSILLPNQVGRPLGLTLPLLLIASVALLGYVMYLRATYAEELSTTPPSHPLAQALVLLTLGLLGTLWAVSTYASQVGTQIATNLVADLSERSSVVLYSTERLGISGTDVEVAEIAQPGSRYRYQYSGLRLLTHTTDKYLLLPAGWQRGRDRVFVIQDDGSIRIDIAVR